MPTSESPRAKSETSRRKRLPPAVRREQITAAAREVFLAYGLEGAKTRQIADAANVTETVLYRHFRSKEEIFEEAILSRVEDLTEELLSLSAEFSNISSRRRYELSQQVHERLLEVVYEITPLLGVALFSNREAGQQFYRNRLSPLFSQAAKALSLGMAPRVQALIDSRTLLLAFVGMDIVLSLDAQLRHRPLDVTKLAANITDLVAFGVYPSAHEL